MQQQSLFDLKENSNSNKKAIPKEHSYEEEFPNLDFVLVPYAFLLGVNTKHIAGVIKQNNLLCELFCKNSKSQLKVLNDTITFLEKECLWFKKDPSKFISGDNRMTFSRLKEIFVSGAIEIKLRHGSMSKIKKSFRSKLPESNPPLLFGKIARYINNGFNHEFWYEETGKEIASLFPAFDPELIASLLAITSIKANLTSNVTKFFKALDQFYKNETHTVAFGKRSDKKMIESSFKGFLDASLHHLNLLKKGGSLLSPENATKNGRKIKRFTGAIGSDEDAIVDDVWITRAFGCDRKREFRGRIISQSPTKAIYDATEWYLQMLASLVGKKARGLCAMIWVGIRQETTKKTARYTDTIKDRLNHGLFSNQHGNLKVSKNGGIEFENL